MSRAEDGVPLHPIERKVLATLGGDDQHQQRDALGFDALVSATGLLPDQVRRSISWLTSKGLVSVQESSRPVLSRASGADEQPPELSLMSRLEENQGSLPMASLRGSFGSNQEFSAAVGRASSAGWVAIGPGPTGPVVSLKTPDGARALRELLEMVAQAGDGGLEEGRVPEGSKQLAADLLRRGLLQRKELKLTMVSATGAGLEALSAAHGEYTERLTPEVLASARSTGKAVVLRPIDVEARAPTFYPGRRHPVKEFINEVREVYLSMGFVEIAGAAVQSSFWNFDALFTPQDHPARELQDTFYIKGGRDATLERRDAVARVADAHERGWMTGSKGWRYGWDVEEARRLVLRTHNTALTIKATMDSGGRDARVFSVGRVYRNENLDYKHLAELHQMEGIVIGDGLNLRHLMGILTEFYGKLGMSGVKLWPSYFPYTEPSMQVMTYYDKVGKWLEMGGSGIFRPEVTWPLGVRKPVLAWGCGLERLLMLRLGIEDIRDLYRNDLGWLRSRREIASPQDIL